MSKSELKYLRHLLKAFQPRSYPKAVQMINLICQNPAISQQELVVRLYGDPQNKSFFHLKNSLCEKMMEVLTLDVNLTHNPEIQDDLATFIPVRLNKQLLNAFVLHKRGLGDYAREILENCIEEADSWDIPELKLMALIQLRNMSCSREKVLEEYTQLIQTALQQFETDIMGIGYMDELRVVLPQPANEELIQRLEQYTIQLEKRLDEVYSPKGHYYYLMLKFILLEARQAPLEECKEVLTQIIGILDQHKGLRSRNRSGVPYVKLSEIELKSYHFCEAYQAGLKAMEILPQHRNNYMMAGINAIHACLFMGRFSNAHSILQLISRHINYIPDGIHAGWITYLHSYYYFLTGDYREALNYFHQITQFEHAKSNWNPALRIYEIQLYIELQWFDFVGTRLEALRKYLDRHEVYSRITVIYQLLYQLEKCSCNFQLIDIQPISTLIETGHENRWEPLSYEVFPFEFWFMQKYHKQNMVDGLPFKRDYLLAS